VNDLGAGFETTIHWHGIEGNNAADGTHTTQTPVMDGDTFTYDFVVTRPGLFWYHPHVRGAQGVFDGLYAPLVVDDPDEVALRASGVLPENERVLVLSDVSEIGGVPWSVEVDNAMEIMNGTEGAHLLVNGREDPVLEIGADEPVRLRLLNASITRFWRLQVPGHTLYRVGGEGGLLDHVRVEGGTVVGSTHALADGADKGETEIDLGFARGEILLAPGERADVVLVATGGVGEELELRWEDYARGRHGMWMEGDEMVMGDKEDDGQRPGETVAKLGLVQGTASAGSLDEGSPVLASIGRAVGEVDTTKALDWTGDEAMVLSEEMAMWQDAEGVWQMSTDLFVDGVSWEGDHMGGPDQPEAPSAVHADLGDVLLWEVRNESHMAHPFHLHGFSFQPVSYTRYHVDEGAEFETAASATTWDVGYDEFEDTVNIPGETSVLVRVELADPLGTGAAAGRWMRHCHILQHGENGMMSELIVAR
jgi:FtsP/CotA-like multicopper oxidase with cupredoxin domain